MISVQNRRQPLNGNKLLLFCFVFLFMNFSEKTEAQDKDTIKVKKSSVIERIDGKKYYIHEVEKGQTVYSIAEAYNVTPKQVYKYNPDAKEMIEPSQMLKIPVFLVEEDQKLQREEKSETEEKNPEEKKETFGGDSDTIIHKVKEKETLYSLARKYDVKISRIKSLNPGMVDILRKGQKIKIPVSSSTAHRAKSDQPKEDSVIHYEVESGETLYRIAVNHDISVDKIIRMNPEVAKGLKAGATIKLPATAKSDKKPRSFDGRKSSGDKFLKHKVESGETLYSLSVKYSVSIDDIKKYNPELKEGLKAGQELKIPVDHEEKSESPVTLPGRETRDSLVFMKQEDTVIQQCDSVNIKSSYKVALFMPLYLSEVDAIKLDNFDGKGWPEKEFKSLSYIHYYEGFRMALDSLENFGLNAEVYVYDTKSQPNVVKEQVNNPEFKTFDLIFGPLEDELLPIVVSKAKEYSINVVSPLSYDMGLVKGNPHFIKVFPSVDYQIGRITDLVADRFKNSNKIFVYSSENKQTELIKKVQSLIANKCEIRDSVYPWDVVDYDHKNFSAVKNSLSKKKHNLLFFTNKGEAEINRVITKLNGLRKDYDMTILGSNNWENYESIESEYFMNLNYISFTDFLIEYDDVRVKDFVRKFKERYKTWPHKLAFKGFDISFYFLKALFNYGVNFQYCMKYQDVFTMHTKFKFRQWNSNAWQNTFLNIYQHRDFNRVNLLRKYKTPEEEKDKEDIDS